MLTVLKIGCVKPTLTSNILSAIEYFSIALKILCAFFQREVDVPAIEYEEDTEIEYEEGCC